MQLRLKVIIILGLIICILFSGCETKNYSPFKETDYPATVSEIIIKKKPESIICLSPSYTEIICELGSGDKLIGIGDLCNYPPDIKELPSVKTGRNFELNKILSLNPDLVITQTSLSNSQLDALFKYNIQVLTISETDTIEGLNSIYVDLATALNGQLKGPEIGNQQYQKLKKELDAITSKLPDKKLSFLYSIDMENHFATPDTYENSVLSLIGDNLVTNGKEYLADFGDNKINPKIVFINSPDELENAQSAKSLKKISAVKKGDVYVLNHNDFSVHSFRISATIKKIAKNIYPNIQF